MNQNDFADEVYTILKENKQNYTDDFQKMKDRGYLQDYENEEEMREKLSNQFENKGCIENRQTLLDILYWKLNPRNYTSAEKQSKEKDSIEDIQKATARAFSVDEAGKSLEALTELMGVGPAVASTILMFYKPEKYTVLDQHAWRTAVELGMDGEKKDNGYTGGEYAQYNNWCHSILHDVNREGHEILDLRQLDIALHSLGKDLN